MSDETIRQTAEQNAERFKRGLRASCNGAVFDPADLKRKAYVRGYLEGHAAALSEQGEIEWEYSWGGEDWRLDMEFATESAARDFAKRTHWVGEDGYLVRTPKRDWEPVPDTTGAES